MMPRGDPCGALGAEMESILEHAANIVKAPREDVPVHKSQCVLSYDSPLSPEGLLVNISTHQGFARHLARRYGVCQDSPSKTTFFLHIKRKRVYKLPNEWKAEKMSQAAPQTVSISSISGFVDPPKFTDEFSCALVVFGANNDEEIVVPLPLSAEGEWLAPFDAPEALKRTLSAILRVRDASDQAAAVVEWNDTNPKVSKFAKDLIQISSPPTLSSDPETWLCQECGRKGDVWFNLSDGFIGCGRRTYGIENSGCIGGLEGAAVRHFNSNPKYPLVVKLGTIGKSGNPDVFSYAEDEMVDDPFLAQHLSTFGASLESMEKTAKSTAELQVELNKNFNWSRVTEDGFELLRVVGAGHVGLTNLGNSCYMAAPIQALMSHDETRSQLLNQSAFEAAIEMCGVAQADSSLPVQLFKLAFGLYGDRICEQRRARLAEAQKLWTDAGECDETDRFDALRPWMFKGVAAAGHAEFSSSRQQDAEEFLLYLFSKLEEAESAGYPFQITKNFRFALEERLECLQSNQVRYSRQSNNTILSLPVPASSSMEKVSSLDLNHCFAEWAAGTKFEFKSPVTHQHGPALQRYRLGSFPPCLIIQLKRFAVDELWNPVKNETPVRMPDKINLNHLRATGRQPGEAEWKDDSQSLNPHEIRLIEQLMGMGFQKNASTKAVLSTKCSTADAALEWLCSHLEDPHLNDELPSSAVPMSSQPNQLCEALEALGFGNAQSRAAMKMCNNNADLAAEWLLTSPPEDVARAVAKLDGPAVTLPLDDGPGEYELFAFVTHVGKSSSSGHYVAHIKRCGTWLLFNDERVAVSQQPPLELGYLYFYRRVNKS